MNVHVHVYTCMYICTYECTCYTFVGMNDMLF